MTVALEIIYTLQIFSILAPVDAQLPLDYETFGPIFMGINFLVRWDSIIVKWWESTLPATVLYYVLVLS
jgi:hypothetical protein